MRCKGQLLPAVIDPPGELIRIRYSASQIQGFRFRSRAEIIFI